MSRVRIFIVSGMIIAGTENQCSPVPQLSSQNPQQKNISAFDIDLIAGRNFSHEFGTEDLAVTY